MTILQCNTAHLHLEFDLQSLFQFLSYRENDDVILVQQATRFHHNGYLQTQFISMEK
jgi:hypothetical protein